MKISKVDYVDNLYNKAYWCKTALDKSHKSFDTTCYRTAANTYRAYLKEKIKNPVAAKIAMINTVKEHPIKNKDDFTKNLMEIEKNPKVETYLKKIQEIEASQARTNYIRTELLANDRINLNYVKPKLTGWQKLKLRLKILF